MKPTMLDLFEAIGDAFPIADWLSYSAYDELIEIDLSIGRYRILDFVDYKDAHAASEGDFSELVQFTLDNLILPEDSESYLRFVDPKTLLERTSHSKVPGVLIGDFRFKIRTGEWRWVQLCLLSGVEHGFGDNIVRMFTFDVQVQKDRSSALQPGLQSKSTLLRDEKTGLLWDRSFFLEANKRLSEVDQTEWCAIAIDMDHFSLFNDWYGRDKGDLLLARLGEELGVAENRLGGVAGYLGQDDFCFIAPYHPDKISNLYNRLSGLITELTSAIGFKPIFGVCVLDDKTPFLDQFDHAKLALDYARTDYKTDIYLYEPSMQEKDEREYRILLDFQRALNENEFIIYLQPQCRISSGKIIGVEALVRWLKPNGEIVPPVDFIPVLEKHGFITDLDCYVWEMVCKNLRVWIDSGHQPIPASVNVSQDDFYNIDVADFFEQLIAEYNVPPSLLKIEITESAFADNSTALSDTIKRLRDAGFTVLMDDFGSGYSSLNRLGNLNVDVIKLDAAFFRMDETGKRKGIRIVESIVNMAKTMALPIICEGVETKEQIEFLDSLGCRYVQGFYYYRPMSVNDFETLIGDGVELDDRGLVMKQNEQIRIREFLDQNVYSDAMLNSILGPVAFYLWNGDNVDIIRFNEQFYEAVGIPDFAERLDGIQQFVPENDRPKFIKLFERATIDQLNGASDIVGFYKSDGTLSRFMLRMYYLGENEEGKRFYGSARDVTEITDLQTELALLSDRLSTSIVFMRWLKDRWAFKVIIHGLADEMGLSREDFQQELDDGRFLERIDKKDFDGLYQAVKKSIHADTDFLKTITLSCGDGNDALFKLEAGRMKDSTGDASYIITINPL